MILYGADPFLIGRVLFRGAGFGRLGRGVSKVFYSLGG